MDKKYSIKMLFEMILYSDSEDNAWNNVFDIMNNLNIDNEIDFEIQEVDEVE